METDKRTRSRTDERTDEADCITCLATRLVKIRPNKFTLSRRLQHSHISDNDIIDLKGMTKTLLAGSSLAKAAVWILHGVDVFRNPGPILSDVHGLSVCESVVGHADVLWQNGWIDLDVVWHVRCGGP